MRYIIALEISSSKLRGALASAEPGTPVDIIAVEEEKITDKVRYGCIQNVEIAQPLQRIIQRLQDNIRIAPRKITGVYLSLGARSMLSRSVEASVTLPVETEITQPIVNDLRKSAERQAPADRDVVEAIPVRFTVDNKAVADPVGSYGSSLSAQFTLVTIAPQVKRMLRRVVNERMGLQINGYIPRPLAESEITLSDDERSLGCMFVDFGAETTTVVIYRNSRPVYIATLPIGSRNITLDIKTLNIPEERAEEIKKTHATATPAAAPTYRQNSDTVDFTEVNNLVNARAKEIIANILAQIQYAGLRDADIPGGIIIVGSGARLRGFSNLMADQTGLKVRQGSPSANVRISDGSIDRTEMLDVIATAVAAGKLPPALCLANTSDDARVADTSQFVDADPSTSYAAIYADSSVDGQKSRIGILDEEEEIDEDEPTGTDNNHNRDNDPFSGHTKPEKTKSTSSSWGLKKALNSMINTIERMVDNETEFED